MTTLLTCRLWSKNSLLLAPRSQETSGTDVIAEKFLTCLLTVIGPGLCIAGTRRMQGSARAIRPTPGRKMRRFLMSSTMASGANFLLPGGFNAHARLDTPYSVFPLLCHTSYFLSRLFCFAPFLAPTYLKTKLP